ncbi:protein-methionine-sulfoxide reductase heme-binding subunit MsrQ [Rhizobiaceae bacterium n13]|uniref:Protein-methionine-sulfoxide reductase heme-binding subunit MsrQ n=1 Tax=Ferirhizobium litorale TaxID=2927786 RepID=A0AAE3QF99_9HYPH|nr:protein-methionine-sulfoxide reductase heme-binding subunit MsrQ [Fererhizobium litorale]MDI7865160.1 protein-methionine-sulfoxide reductase heme-binding subunit MsrQ [Fererhizobium litorale]MDI7922868.1 protein-methionine-sulfoxide reductase heme-binding subunit MsrQ [Fererhizobium litorale]
MSSFTLPRKWQGASVWALYAVGLAPAIWSFYLGATGSLGADPVKTFERSLGLWALRFIIATLAVSPLRELGGPNLIRYRRALGLLAFYYALMHFTAYMVLDQRLDLHAVIADIIKRPYITIGMASLVMLVPLALTSNSYSIRKLGHNWNRLHKLVYLIAAGAALHFAMLVKVITLEPAIYIAIVALLLAYRPLRPYLKRRKKQRSVHQPAQ